MDEKLIETFQKYLEMQMAKEAREAEAQKAAAEEKAPKYVTADDLKSAMAEMVESVKAMVKEAVEDSQPIRAEGAGRAGEPGEAQKAAEVNPLDALAKKPVDQLTAADKALKADVIRTLAVKGMK